MLTIGIDLGSTTVKYALLSESGVLLSHDYVRHGSAVKQTLEKVLRALALRTHDAPVHVLFSGSGALGLADALGAGFVQEVIAASRYLKHRAPDLDAAIELGGEDAKLLYLSNGVELRMNEACAGGTALLSIKWHRSWMLTQLGSTNSRVKPRSRIRWHRAAACLPKPIWWRS